MLTTPSGGAFPTNILQAVKDIIQYINHANEVLVPWHRDCRKCILNATYFYSCVQITTCMTFSIANGEHKRQAGSRALCCADSKIFGNVRLRTIGLCVPIFFFFSIRQTDWDRSASSTVRLVQSTPFGYMPNIHR